MSFVHGQTGGVLVAQYDLSLDLTQYNFGKTRQLVDVTTFPAAGSGSKGDKDWLSGLGEGQISVQGVWNPASNQSDEEINALDGTEVVISASPQGFNAIGDKAEMVNGFIENYQPRSPNNDAVRFTSGVKASAGAYLGVVLHPHTRRS